MTWQEVSKTPKDPLPTHRDLPRHDIYQEDLRTRPSMTRRRDRGKEGDLHWGNEVNEFLRDWVLGRLVDKWVIYEELEDDTRYLLVNTWSPFGDESTSDVRSPLLLCVRVPCKVHGHPRHSHYYGTFYPSYPPVPPGKAPILSLPFLSRSVHF